VLIYTDAHTIIHAHMNTYSTHMKLYMHTHQIPHLVFPAIPGAAVGSGAGGNKESDGAGGGGGGGNFLKYVRSPR